MQITIKIMLVSINSDVALMISVLGLIPSFATVCKNKCMYVLWAINRMTYFVLCSVIYYLRVRTQV